MSAERRIKSRKSADNDVSGLDIKDSSAGEECRCKEMSKKNLPGLLKTVFRDFAFWKKRAKRI